MEQKQLEQTRAIAGRVAQTTKNMTPLAFENDVRAWFKDNGKKLINLCGDKSTAMKLMVVAANEVARNPKLIECDQASFFRCLLYSAEVGLFPGAAQECAFVPLQNNKTGKLEANFWPMYQGIVKLVYQSKQVKRIGAEVVYSADFFEFQKGSDAYLKHIPFLGPNSERGERICVYAVAETIFGGVEFVVRSMDFIEGIKARSPAARSSSSPWKGSDDDYDAMARKTMLKQLAKVLPKNSRLSRAIELDNAVERPDLAAPTEALKINFVDEGEQQDSPPRLETPPQEAVKNPS